MIQRDLIRDSSQRATLPVALKNPIPVYTAATNADAQLIACHLAARGVDAFAVDDMSPGGMYALGTLSELHRPQVFVDRSRVNDAVTLLARYESRLESYPERYCYHCGMWCSGGEVACRECHAMLDLRATMSSQERKGSCNELSEVVTTMSFLRDIRKPIAFVFLVPMLIGYTGLGLRVIGMFLKPFFD